MLARALLRRRSGFGGVDRTPCLPDGSAVAGSRGRCGGRHDGADPRGGVLREMRGQDDALSVPGIEEVTITAELGEELVPLPEGTRYLGFMIARSATPEAVEAALREAHGRLTFLIEDSNKSGPGS